MQSRVLIESTTQQSALPFQYNLIARIHRSGVRVPVKLEQQLTDTAPCHKFSEREVRKTSQLNESVQSKDHRLAHDSLGLKPVLSQPSSTITYRLSNRTFITYNTPPSKHATSKAHVSRVQQSGSHLIFLLSSIAATAVHSDPSTSIFRMLR